MGRFLGIFPEGGIAKLTNSRLFKKLASDAFDQCDKDKTGKLSENEFHICMLLVYDKLNDKLPCHLRVPSPKQVKELFNSANRDADNATLNKEEFMVLASELFVSEKKWWDSVAFKVVASIAMRVALFPIAGKLASVVSKTADLPVLEKVSPAIWAVGAESAYKVLRVPIPELP